MHHEFDVLVIGGGIVGLTAALAMAQRGYSVAVLEASALKVQGSNPDTRVYAINQASQHLFKQLGVWQFMDTERMSPYNKMHVWDASNAAFIDFDSRTIAEQSLGHIIEESVIKKALLKEVEAQTGIKLFPECAVDKVQAENDSVQVFSKERCFAGRLLMIADGANSPTRQKLHVKVTSWSYHQSALVATVRTENPHQKTAYQVFHADGPLAFLPLSEPNQCSIVWSTIPERVNYLMKVDEQVFNAELTAAFAEKLGRVEVVSKRHQFPLQMRHVNQYSGMRWLLLGDAAHTIHPLAGLGLNLGLADVRAWMECLDSMPGKDFSKKQLSHYQRERKHTVWQTIMLMEGFKNLFSYTARPISSLRGLGLSLCNKLTPLKRLFIQHAAG